MDVVDRATRSRMMSGIRGKDTKPELVVRSYLHRAGLRFRLHARLPGRPDLVFPKYRTVVFVHGCFWHRHKNCALATTPSSNVAFWLEKFDGNVLRDETVKKQLKALGWTVHTIWSCQLSQRKLDSLAAQVRMGGAKRGHDKGR